MDIHWNLEKLKEIKLDPVPVHEKDGNEILRIWSGLSKYEEPVENDERNIEGYINFLYKGLNPKEVWKWKHHDDGCQLHEKPG